MQKEKTNNIVEWSQDNKNYTYTNSEHDINQWEKEGKFYLLNFV